MSDTAASIRAAKEVQADTLAPELYRKANEWFFRAKNEYKMKNFALAAEYAEKAQRYAEQAEFTAIQTGGARSEQTAPDPLADTPRGVDANQSPAEHAPVPALPPTSAPR